ncbi:MAG TPA: MarR family transcriptional regulator [Thermoplasmatales archaeon]|nr:MarR family transcriptional regulator [Thermoplasmatales archaeon]
MPPIEKHGEEQSLGKLISIIHWQSRMYVESKLKPYNLGWGEFHVLRKLYGNRELRQNEITDRLKITKATTSKVIKKLEKDGYIVRKRDRTDNRTYVIKATRRAMKLKSRLERISREWNSILLEGFDESEKRSIEHALSKMAENAKGE